MSSTSHRLAKLLAERYGEIVPPPLTVRARGDDVQVYAGGEGVGGSTAAGIIDHVDDLYEVDDDDVDDGDSFSERAERAASAVLSTIQDDVMKYLTLQWPLGPGGEAGMPRSRTDAQNLYLWFGADDGTEILRLRPIAFSEILEP